MKSGDCSFIQILLSLNLHLNSTFRPSLILFVLFVSVQVILLWLIVKSINRKKYYFSLCFYYITSFLSLYLCGTY